jgi:hypothetical protein
MQCNGSVGAARRANLSFYRLQSSYMAKTSALFQQYARMGAPTRLTELRTEIDAIENAFPDLASRR